MSRLTDDQITRLQKATEAGTWEFAVHVCGLGRMNWMRNDSANRDLHSNCVTDEQKTISRFINSPSSRTPYKAIIASRKTLKTTFLQCDTMRDICLNRNDVSAYGGANKPLVIERMDMLRAFLSGADERSLIPDVWGPMLGSGRGDGASYNRATGFSVLGRTKHSGYPTVKAFSVDAPITGWHGKKIRLDDFQDEHGADSEQSRANTIRSFDHARPLLLPGGQIIYAGTPYHMDDMTMRILRGEMGLWDVLFLPAYNYLPGQDEKKPWDRKLDFGSLRFPWNLPEWVLEVEREGAEEMFACQYLLNPLATAERIFHEMFYGYWTVEQYQDCAAEENQFRYGVADLAFTDKKRSDTSAALFYRYWKESKKAVIGDGFFGKVDSMDYDRLAPELLDRSLACKDTSAQYTLYIEDGGGPGYALIYKAMERLMAERCQYIDIQPVKDKRDEKKARARNTKPRYQNGGYLFPPIPEDAVAGDWRRELRKQLLEYPNGQHDDFVDCLSYSEMILPVHAGGGSVQVSRPEIVESATDKCGGFHPERFQMPWLREKPPWADTNPRRVIRGGETRGGRSRAPHNGVDIRRPALSILRRGRG